MSCPECGSNLKSEVVGSTVVISCEKCGWSVARSYVNPIYEDETVYSLYLENGNGMDKQTLACLSKVVGCNYLQAKKLIDSGKILLLKGGAVAIREKCDILKEGKVEYSIEPAFPY